VAIPSKAARHELNVTWNQADLYSMMGREKEARAEAAEVLRMNPTFSLDEFVKKFSVIINPKSHLSLKIGVSTKLNPGSAGFKKTKCFRKSKPQRGEGL
jgi:hypothetical protein